MIRFALIIAFFCVGASARISPIEYEYTGIHHDPNHPEALSYPRLKEIISRHGISSVDALLEWFNQSEKDSAILDQAAFMYSSSSAQAAGVSPEFPRAILYKDRLVLGITGNPDHPQTYQSIEVMDFHPPTATFHFHQIEFNEGKAVFHDAPQNCVGCHGGRPIWDSYNFWPGAFGGRKDAIPAKSIEAKYFADFLKEKAGKGRYTHIQTPKASYSEILGYDLSDSPNFKLGLFLSRLNLSRVTEGLVKWESFDRYQLAIAGAIAGCSVEELLPEKVLIAHAKRLGVSSRSLIQSTRTRILADFQKRIDRYNDLNESDWVMATGIHSYNSELRGQGISLRDTDYARSTGALRFILEGAGYSMVDWSISRRPGGSSYSFSTGAYGLRDYLYHDLGAAIRKTHPSLWPGVEIEAKEPALEMISRGICEKLGPASLRALGGS